MLEGARTVSTTDEPTGPGMPSFGWKLNDGEIAAVLTYVRNSWGLAAPAVTADEVAATRRSLAERTEHQAGTTRGRVERSLLGGFVAAGGGARD